MLKNISLGLLVLSLFATSLNSLAAPSSFVIMSPSKIDIRKNRTTGEFDVIATLGLACSNQNATDWAQVVTSYDDSGDRIVVVGVAVPASDCNRTNVEQPFKITGSIGKGWEGSTFKPMTVETYNNTLKSKRR